ncbi:MAG: cbb3-type cytochrome oxidase assembly protein CcoS [Desulfocapsa sp.]|nr:MAG: cbb3-type cytochrome oxidase assembly protein CcoS [Desulfocapsa sp.]
MTIWTLVTLLFLTLALGFGGWILFMWGVKTGQFDDIEGPKYRMLDDGDDIPLESRKRENLESADSLAEQGDGKKDHY